MTHLLDEGHSVVQVRAAACCLIEAVRSAEASVVLYHNSELAHEKVEPPAPDGVFFNKWGTPYDQGSKLPEAAEMDADWFKAQLRAGTHPAELMVAADYRGSELALALNEQLILLRSSKRRKT